jgi:DNA-binding NarL/FixJ family response regulator
VGWISTHRVGSGFLCHAHNRPLACDLVKAGPATSGESSPARVITLVTVDGDPLARRALRARLAAERDLDIVGEAPDPSRGIEIVTKQQPDLVLMAVLGGDRHSCGAIGQMITASPQTRVIALAIDRDEDAQMRLLRAGAAGWLMKSVALEVLPRVLRGVHAGEAAVPRALCKRIVREAIGAGPAGLNRLRPIQSSLTRREWEVLDLLAEGATTARIAAELQLRQATIRTHIKHMLRKLWVHSRDQAVRHAERLRRNGGGRSRPTPSESLP